MGEFPKNKIVVAAFCLLAVSAFCLCHAGCDNGHVYRHEEEHTSWVSGVDTGTTGGTAFSLAFDGRNLYAGVKASEINLE